VLALSIILLYDAECDLFFQVKHTHSTNIHNVYYVKLLLYSRKTSKKQQLGSSQ